MNDDTRATHPPEDEAGAAEATSSVPLVTLLVPVYNEEDNVERAYEALVRVMEPLAVDWELIFTDNHSADRTFDLVRVLAEADPRVRGFRFSRNFGFQRSILAGYRLSRGDAAIQLDCDLQDPPELIPLFLDKWREGYKVVYGVRRSRQEGFLITLARRVFYRLIDALSEHQLPHDAGDFRLVDRAAIDELSAIRDSRPYLRGTLAGMGFPQIGVPYDRRAREAGVSKFAMRDLFALALDGILSQSTIPLRVASYVGMIVFVVTMFVAAGYVVAKLLVGADWPAGFTTLLILLLASIALNSIFLGVIGEYLSRIFDMLRHANEVVIEERVDPADRG